MLEDDLEVQHVGVILGHTLAVVFPPSSSIVLLIVGCVEFPPRVLLRGAMTPLTGPSMIEGAMLNM